MWVADYVLMEYGTGAIMAVPGHDERDYEFAEKFGLPIRRVIDGGERAALHAATGRWSTPAASTASGNREALEQIVDWLDDEGAGHRSINYRLRDWLLSRQRYWGCPIPIVHCDAAGSCRCRRTSCRSRCPTSRTTRRRAARRWPRRRTG